MRVSLSPLTLCYCYQMNRLPPCLTNECSSRSSAVCACLCNVAIHTQRASIKRVVRKTHTRARSRVCVNSAGLTERCSCVNLTRLLLLRLLSNRGSKMRQARSGLVVDILDSNSLAPSFSTGNHIARPNETSRPNFFDFFRLFLISHLVTGGVLVSGFIPIINPFVFFFVFFLGLLIEIKLTKNISGTKSQSWKVDGRYRRRGETK